MNEQRSVEPMRPHVGNVRCRESLRRVLTAAVGLGRVKSLRPEEHVPNSRAIDSKTAQKPYAGRTRFPSVRAFSGFLHDQDHEWEWTVSPALVRRTSDKGRYRCGAENARHVPIGHKLAHKLARLAYPTTRNIRRNLNITLPWARAARALAKRACVCPVRRAP